MKVRALTVLSGVLWGSEVGLIFTIRLMRSSRRSREVVAVVVVVVVVVAAVVVSKLNTSRRLPARARASKCTLLFRATGGGGRIKAYCAPHMCMKNIGAHTGNPRIEDPPETLA